MIVVIQSNRRIELSYLELFSLGMWKGFFDVNAIDKVEGRRYVFPDAQLRHSSVTIARTKLVSVCSMDMQFRREVSRPPINCQCTLRSSQAA